MYNIKHFVDFSIFRFFPDRMTALVIGCLLMNIISIAQTKVFDDTLLSPYYQQRASLFSRLPQTTGGIIFLGNSLTDGNEWAEMMKDSRVINRGISGDITAGVIRRLGEVTRRKPEKIFLMIGINDLALGISPDSIIRNIKRIVSTVHKTSPATKIYIQSILPVNPGFNSFKEHTARSGMIQSINKSLGEMASSHSCSFIDLYSRFIDSGGYLRNDLTNDGLHLNGDGYMLWKHLVWPSIYDLNPQPSLIPFPQHLKWQEGFFPVYKCSKILLKDNDLYDEALKLKGYLEDVGILSQVVTEVNAGDFYVELALNNNIVGEESYHLTVNVKKIEIEARSSHGIFNALQTLRQLYGSGTFINNCYIEDRPAFSWRGYMVDVGRNYMSIDILKQQIDIISRYKLNVFHFHPTEDIAWRLTVKRYPQLTDARNMLRDKGMYYTEREIRDLIEYCKARHITFVPEIDMPGHSAAFRRAMKTDMQSDSGLAIVKEIITDFCSTYRLPYLHIGADEVKITNNNFIPEISSLLDKLNVRVIGWQPGGNFNRKTIRQLWMTDNGHDNRKDSIQYIDSRHLYLNHMDPLEAVVTIFNRQIGDQSMGDSLLLGGTLCTWHDRSVGQESDILKMNPVYPGLLAFSERLWKGGGQAGWITNIINGNPGSFEEFERRLLDHKQLVFARLPFPYVKQSHLNWTLTGPFDNGGDNARIFAPEHRKTNLQADSVHAIGGTVILRHWWPSLVKGVLKSPRENTTWYGSARLWSDIEGEKDFWIGFGNISRSQATDSPPYNKWDAKGSRIWVNGKPINPPQWLRASQSGDLEIPLVDEGYEYRTPQTIVLKKGWNDVLVKLPVTSFSGKDWNNPVKWMFTFIPIN